MKRQLAVIFFALSLFSPGSFARASSLDELYRDIIRSDNEGYLPLFVKNRKKPDILGGEQTMPQAPSSEKKSVEDVAPVSLINPIPAREAAVKAKQLKWEQTLRAVEQNRVTPLELDEIRYRLSLNDPKAIEVMAWMYTKGVGVQVNYVEAYKLYQKAAALNIPHAHENALLLFKAMNEDQRNLLKGY